MKRSKNSVISSVLSLHQRKMCGVSSGLLYLLLRKVLGCRLLSFHQIKMCGASPGLLYLLLRKVLGWLCLVHYYQQDEQEWLYDLVWFLCITSSRGIYRRGEGYLVKLVCGLSGNSSEREEGLIATTAAELLLYLIEIDLVLIFCKFRTLLGGEFFHWVF